MLFVTHQNTAELLYKLFVNKSTEYDNNCQLLSVKIKTYDQII